MSEDRASALTPPPRTEDRILKNALKHFCDFGYTGTSVRDITAASEVTKPTLYYYFKNKEELFSKLALSCFDLVINRVKKKLQNENDTRSRINALFDAYEEIFNEQPDALKFIYSISVSPQRGSPDVGAKRFSSQIDSFIGSIVKAAAEKGECLPSKVHALEIFLTSLFAFHTTCLLTADDPASCQKARSVLSALCLCMQNSQCEPAN